MRQICAVTMGMNTLSHRWMSDSNFFASLTIRFVHTPSLDVALLLLLWHVYISLLSLHLAGPASLLCFEFSLKLNSSYLPPQRSWLARLHVNAHPLSRRRLQLTIVGFHHRHECTASPVMACQWIFFTPLSLCLSLMPSFSPPSHLEFTWSGYGLLYCQTHSLHYVQMYTQTQPLELKWLSVVIIILSCAYLFSSTFPQILLLSTPVWPSILVVLSGCEGCCILVLLD